MTGQERIREVLFSLLSSVEGIGQVHKYERFASKPVDFQKLYAVENNIRGFYIHRQSCSETRYSTQDNKLVTRWIIKGFASLVDAKETELSFDLLLDAIASKFRSKPILVDEKGNNLCHVVVNDSAGVQLEESSPVMFAGVLCHSATLSLLTEHYEQVEPNISDPTVSPKPGKEKKGCPGFRAAISPNNKQVPDIEAIGTFSHQGEDNG